MENRRIIAALCFLIAFQTFVGFLYLRHEQFFQTPQQIAVLTDHVREALVARNWLNGHGWTTPVVPLYSLNVLKGVGLLQKGPPWPNSDRFPLPILISAGLMKIFGQSAIVGIFLDDRLYFLLALIILFILMLYQCKDWRAAFLAGLLFITNTDLATSIVWEKTGSDIFMCLAGLAAMLVWLRKPSSYRSLVVGLVCGLAFLMRYNEGAAMLVIASVSCALYYGQSQFPFVQKEGFISLQLIALAFVVTLIPLFIHNIDTFHKLFFMINSQFQLILDTRYVSFTDTWFKLEGPMRDLSLFKIVSMIPMDLSRRAVTYTFNTLYGFILFGQQCLIWPLVGFGIQRAYGMGGWKDRQMDRGIIFLAFFGILSLALSILTAAPFVGFGPGVAYSLWCYVPFIMIASSTAVWFWDHQLARNKLSQAPNSAKVAALLTFAALGVFFVGSIPGAFDLKQNVMLRPLFWDFKTYSWLMVLVFGLTVSAYLMKSRMVRILCLVCFLLIPFAMETLAGPPQSRAVEPMYLNLANESYAQMRTVIGPREIVLSTGFPFLAWFLDRPCLALPEYPELIYNLISDYKLPIRGIFFYQMNTFVPAVLASNWNYGFDGYARLSRYAYPIRGFVLSHTFPLLSPQLGAAQFYVRDESIPLDSLLRTTQINFGDPSDSIHLTYGWGPATSEQGRRFSVAYQNSRRQHPYPHDEWYRYNMRPISDAEFTFMLRRPFPSRVRLVLRSMNTQEMSGYINADLTYYEKFDNLMLHRVVEAVQLPANQWITVDMPLPPNQLREGLNKIGLLFSHCQNPEKHLSQPQENPATVCAAVESATFL